MPRYPIRRYGATSGASAVKAAKRKRKYKIRKFRSSRAQARQILSVNRRLDYQAAAKARNRGQVGLFSEVHSDTLGDYGSRAVILCQPARTAGATSQAWAEWGPSNQNVLENNRVRVGRIYVNMQFSTFRAVNHPISYTVYHVRLNPKNAEITLSNAGNDLNGISQTGGYFLQGNGGAVNGVARGKHMIQLNPNIFIVKKCWKFTLQNKGALPPSTDPIAESTAMGLGTKNISYSFPANYTLGKSTGQWRSLSADGDTAPHLKNYFLIFSDSYLNTPSESTSYRFQMSTIVTDVN